MKSKDTKTADWSTSMISYMKPRSKKILNSCLYPQTALFDLVLKNEIREPMFGRHPALNRDPQKGVYIGSVIFTKLNT